MSILKSFIIKPKVKFEFQHDDEEIIFLVRAHPITQIYWVINGFLMGIIIFILISVFSVYLTSKQIVFIFLFAIVFIFSYWWFSFLSWYFNVGIVTSQRVIDIDFYYLTYKEITSALLDNIEDITIKSGGFFPSIFNYGNVFVQTAGTKVNIEFMNCPQPEKIKEIINNLLQKNQ